MSQILREEEVSLSEFRRLYQGTAWVTDYLMDIHYYRLGKGETVPATLQFSELALFGHDVELPSPLLTIDLTLLICELNKRARNFYATEKEKSQIRDTYSAWLNDDTTLAQLISIKNIPNGKECLIFTPELRPTSNTNQRLAATFHYHNGQWFRLIDEAKDLRANAWNESLELDAYDNGNYAEMTLENRAFRGSLFRGGKSGTRIFGWLHSLEVCANLEHRQPWGSTNIEDWTTTPDDSRGRQFSTFSTISHTTIANIKPARHALPQPEYRHIWHRASDKEMAPSDSHSVRGHINPGAAFAEEGWDDTPDEELGWDVSFGEDIGKEKVFNCEPHWGRPNHG